MPLVNHLPDPFTAWGFTSYSAGTVSPFASHFHDCDEWYFLISGQMVVRSEGVTYNLCKGDCLWTPMGEEHEILEVTEDSQLFWLEGPLRGDKRMGHLHR
jgi:mannose-6-phosphate isomerase-like protein (cupin superfamily)